MERVKTARESSICCYSNGAIEYYGIIQKKILCPSSPALAIIRPFQTSTSLLKSIGNLGREVLKYFADIDLLGALFVCFKAAIARVGCTYFPH